MDKKPSLISVIVPFYNLRDCVGYCMESLLAQDYDGEHEFILIDDGSTDGTGDLLDAYASNPCVRVIHQKNGGQSCARNRGVLEAHGDYVTFVDGDDVVSPHYLSLLANALSKSGAEQVIGRHLIVPGTRAIQALEWSDSREYELLDQESFLSHILYEDVIASAWAHLASRKTYLANPFASGRRYEDDIAFGAQVLSAASFALLKEPIYGYMRRAGSTVRPANTSLKQLHNFSAAIQAIEDAAKPFLPGCASGLTYHKALELTRLFRIADHCNEGGEEPRSYQVEALSCVRRNLMGLLADPGVRRGDKARFLAIAGAPWLYTRLIEAYERREMRRATPHL